MYLLGNTDHVFFIRILHSSYAPCPITSILISSPSAPAPHARTLTADLGNNLSLTLQLHQAVSGDITTSRESLCTNEWKGGMSSTFGCIHKIDNSVTNPSLLDGIAHKYYAVMYVFGAETRLSWSSTDRVRGRPAAEDLKCTDAAGLWQARAWR